MKSEIYEELADKLETAIEWQVEYESSHDDAGGEYACCLPDACAYNNAEKRLAKYLETHGVEYDAETILKELLNWDQYEIHAGHIFTDSRFDYLGEGNYRGPQPYLILDSFPVGEVHVQFCLPDLASMLEVDEQSAREFSAIAIDDRRFCCRRETDGGLLCFENTDSVWYYVVSMETIEGIISDIECSYIV